MIPKGGEGADDNGGGAPFTPISRITMVRALRVSGSSSSPACNLVWYPVFAVMFICLENFVGLASLSKHAQQKSPLPLIQIYEQRH